MISFFLLAALLTSMAPSTHDVAHDDALVAVINAYRVEHGLPAIPVSPSLTLVAEAHVEDLLVNAPDQGECNMHSWSPTKRWGACCYTGDHKRASCMWNKPRELTRGRYKANGYEIVTWHSAGMTPERALELWISSPGHRAMILNEDIWKSVTWHGIGAAIGDRYAVAWFGEDGG